MDSDIVGDLLRVFVSVVIIASVALGAGLASVIWLFLFGLI